MIERQQFTDILSKGVCLGAAGVLTFQLVTDELIGPPSRLSWTTIGLVLFNAALWIFMVRSVRKSAP
jgi:hypothetical protein